MAFAPAADAAAAPVGRCFWRAWARAGRAPEWAASSSTVRSPLTAAGATGALTAAVWDGRGPAAENPSEDRQSS